MGLPVAITASIIFLNIYLVANVKTITATTMLTRNMIVVGLLGGREFFGASMRLIHTREIYIYNSITEKRQLLLLLIRKDIDETVKYSLCHHREATLKELAYMQYKRYFVEKTF